MVIMNCTALYIEVFLSLSLATDINGVDKIIETPVSTQHSSSAPFAATSNSVLQLFFPVHLSKTISTQTEHNNLHKGMNYSRTVALDRIRLILVDLINLVEWGYGRIWEAVRIP